jgi:hypothetical protein
VFVGVAAWLKPEASTTATRCEAGRSADRIYVGHYQAFVVDGLKTPGQTSGMLVSGIRASPISIWLGDGDQSFLANHFGACWCPLNSCPGHRHVRI